MAQGAFVIIQNDGRDILLVKRKDIPLWDLPGGGIAEGETPEAAAVREAFEETGYNVTIIKKAGEYKGRHLKIHSTFSSEPLPEELR